MEEYIIVSKQPSIVIVESNKIGMRLDAGNYRQDYLVNRDQIRHSAFGSKKLVELLVKPSFRGRGFPETPSGQDPVIKVRNVTNYGITGPYDYTDATGISKSDRAWARKGDVLLTVTGLGSSGKADLFFFDTPMLIDGHVAILRCSSICDAGFLKAFLSSSYGQKLSEQDTIGSTGQIELYGSYIDQFDIPYPDPKIQAYIGDKVRLAEKCREEANRLWDEAKQLLANTIGLPLSAEAYQSYNLNEIQSDNYQAVSKTPVICWVHQSIVDDRLGAQFFHPRRENIILKLRDTCELKKLSEVAVRVTKRISAEKAAHLGYVGLSEIDSANGFFEPIPMEKAETVGVSSYFGSGDILFSKLRPYLNKVTICPDHIKEACGSTELLVYRAKRNVRPYYLFFILKSSLGLFQIIDLTTGSTLPRVDPEIIDDLLLPLLTEQIQEEIDRKVRKTFYLLHTARNLINQSQSDVEALIENRLPVDQILSGILRSPNFDEILTKCSLE